MTDTVLGYEKTSFSKASAEEDAVGRSAVRKAQYALIPVCFLIAIVTYLDRSNLAFAASQVEKDIGLGNSQYGLASGILFIGYAVFQIPSQLIVVKVGAPIWLAFLIFAWGVVEMATAAVKNPGQFYALRFLLGTFEAGCFPAIFYHMTLFLTESEMALAYALVTTAVTLSQVVGGPLAGGILYLDGKAGLSGWQWLFILEGAITVAWALLIKFVLLTSPETAWCLSPAEQKWLSSRQARIRANAQRRSPLSGKFHGFVASWRLWWLSIIWFLVQCIIYGVLFFTPLIVDAMLDGSFNGKTAAKTYTGKAANWQTCKVALISAILYVPASLAMAVIGYSSKRFKERNLHVSVCLVISGVAFMCIAKTLDSRGAISGFAVMTVAATGTFAVYGPLCSWVAVILHSTGRATGYAWYNTLGGVGGFVGPYIIGQLSDSGGYQTSMITLGAFALASACMALVFRARSVEEEEEQVVAEHQSHPREEMKQREEV